jgi:DNA (cytosine-5)-methyltransferase 1
MKKPTVSTLFAGCGGDTLGFVNAGFELVYANDDNPDACDTLRNKFDPKDKKKIIYF